MADRRNDQRSSGPLLGRDRERAILDGLVKRLRGARRRTAAARRPGNRQAAALLDHLVEVGSGLRLVLGSGVEPRPGGEANQDREGATD